MIRTFTQSGFAVLAFLAAGCAVNLPTSMITVTKPFTSKVTAKAPAELVVDVSIGSVTIKPSEGDAMEVAVTGTLGGQDQATLDDVVVTVIQDANGITTIKARGPNGKQWKIDLTITTPAKTNLTLDTGVGSAKVSGLKGRMKANVGVGNLSVDGLTLTGESHFETGTGNVTLGIATWPKDITLTAETGVGNVSVQLPATLGMNVDASTGVGNLSTKGMKFRGDAKSKTIVGGAVKGRTESEPEGRTLKATSGTGNVKIEAQ